MSEQGSPFPIEHPSMLLIGAAGRNSGKTLLATTLIEKLAAENSVVGAKVTTVHPGRGRCPRGGEGCGVCSSLEEPFRLSRETGLLEGKDTTRMLDSGADPVFWLCAREAHLDEGARALRQELNPETPVVCESNSLRHVIEPGLFVVARRHGSTSVKASCRSVWDLADIVVELDGQSLTPGPDAFSWADGRWAVKRQMTAVVLAGGKSQRMGRDKTLLPVGNRPLIEHVVKQLEPHFEEIIISANEPEKYEFLGLPIVADRVRDQGPMMAIATAMERSRHSKIFVMAADIPVVREGLLRRLLRRARSDVDVVTPLTPEGHFEPLFAVYDRRIKPRLDEALDQGMRPIIALFDELKTESLQLTSQEKLINLNTIDEYKNLIERTIDRDGT